MRKFGLEEQPLVKRPSREPSQRMETLEYAKAEIINSPLLRCQTRLKSSSLS